MNGNPRESDDSQPTVGDARNRQVLFAALTAVATAFMAFWALVFKPVWPMAAGVTVIAIMIAVVCHAMLGKTS